ncbi:hypothetical protein Tco_0808672 [Tanacetum coccineum]
MSENEDRYHDTVLDLEAKLKKNVDLILKLGNSLQGLCLAWDQAMSGICFSKRIGYEQRNIFHLLYPPDKNSNATPSIPASMPTVQRCEKQSVDFELKLQHEKEKHKWDSSFKNKNTNPLDYSWISKMEKLEDENVSLDFMVQSLIKECNNVKLEYQKIFNSIKKTRSQTQTEMDELIAHVSEKTYAYAAIHAENQNLLFTISELKTRLANIEKGMNAASSVKRPMNRDLHVKNSILANSKKPTKKVAVYVRTISNIESHLKMLSQTKRIITNLEWKEIPFNFNLTDIKQQGVGSKSLDGGINECMNRPGIKEDIHCKNSKIRRWNKSKKKYDQPGLKEDHNSKGAKVEIAGR